MLSNAYFLAKIRFDTAENAPAKKIAKRNCKTSHPTFAKGLGASRIFTTMVVSAALLSSRAFCVRNPSTFFNFLRGEGEQSHEYRKESYERKYKPENVLSYYDGENSRLSEQIRLFVNLVEKKMQ